MRIAKILTISMLCLAGGCSMSTDTTLAETQVTYFHMALDDGDGGKIYDESGEDLKRMSQRQEFVDLITAVHRKLGKVVASDKAGWNVNYNTGGRYVTLAYNTRFAQGRGAEQFVYRLSGHKALLVGYHINSNELVTR